MSEDEIKATFVGRQNLLDELISLIECQPAGAGVQHVLIISPRGMGKTTLLLMVRFAVRDRELAAHWQTVKFPEELYGVNDLADFWIQAIDLLATETGDEPLRNHIEKLKGKHLKSDNLQEAALACIRDWCKRNKKRLLLLVDNLDMILEQINDETANARLREVLMNDGTIMLLGCAVSFFHEARSYDQPLYNFFKIYNLDDLKFEQIKELLRKHAELDGVKNFEETLKKNESCIRVLEYFTGGNPRLVLMLYRVVVHSDISEVHQGLEKLLDGVTPYYKAKIESLPPQQRKILDHIARVTGKMREGLTPTEIASAIRLSTNQVSAQLKRLLEFGYVRTANLRGRNSYYTLSEPLYAIWHQMRFGRDARERMQWLVDFLKVWYDAEQMGAEIVRLEARFCEYLSTGHLREARDTLEYRRYIAEAMEATPARTKAIDSIVRGYLDLKDTEVLKKDILPHISLQDVSEETLDQLSDAGLIREQDTNRAKAQVAGSKEAQHQAELAAAWRLGTAAVEAKKWSEALGHFDRAVELDPNFYPALDMRAALLAMSGRYEEALASFDRALGIKSDDADTWFQRGCVLVKLGKYQEAVTSYEHALKIDPNNHDIWVNHGFALVTLGKYKEALASYDHALEIKTNDYESWHNRGCVLAALGKYEEAIQNFDRALEVKPDYDSAWHYRGRVLADLGVDEKAIESYDRAIKIKNDHYEAWGGRADSLAKIGKYEEAIISYDRALKLKSNDDDIWNSRGIAHGELGRYEEAIASFDKALEIKPDFYGFWHNRARALRELDRYEEAVASYDRALQIKPDICEAWNMRGTSLAKLGRYEEAMASFGRGLEIDSNNNDIWNNRGNALNELGKYEEAVGSYDRALQIKQDCDEAWYNRGNTLENLGRYQEAIESYNRAIEINPEKHEAWNNRGITLGKMGRHEEAVESYDRALEIKADKHEAWYNRGSALLELGKYDEAISSYDRALVIRSNDEMAWYMRGNALAKLERYEEAIASYDRALEINRDGFGAQALCGIQFFKFGVRVLQGKMELALHDWNAAADLGKQLEQKNWHELASSALLAVARSGHIKFARQLIDNANLAEPLFPLSRAVDYLLTGDEGLIEKLSPEVRGIVEEIVNELRKTTGEQEQYKTKSARHKVKRGGRRQLRKHLR